MTIHFQRISGGQPCPVQPGTGFPSPNLSNEPTPGWALRMIPYLFVDNEFWLSKDSIHRKKNSRISFRNSVKVKSVGSYGVDTDLMGKAQELPAPVRSHCIM